MISGQVAEPCHQDRLHREPLTPGPIDNATPARFSVDANGTVTDLTALAPLELAPTSFVNNAGAPIRSFVVEQDTVFFRVFSDPARQTGGFLVSTPPQSPSQAISSLALPPENSATLLQACRGSLCLPELAWSLRSQPTPLGSLAVRCNSKYFRKAREFRTRIFGPGCRSNAAR